MPVFLPREPAWGQLPPSYNHLDAFVYSPRSRYIIVGLCLSFSLFTEIQALPTSPVSSISAIGISSDTGLGLAFFLTPPIFPMTRLVGWGEIFGGERAFETSGVAGFREAGRPTSRSSSSETASSWARWAWGGVGDFSFLLKGAGEILCGLLID